MKLIMTKIFLLQICFAFSVFGQTKQIQTINAGIYIPPERHRANNTLPNEIKESLNRQYPGWTFVDNYYIFNFENKMLEKKQYPFDPNFIIGDFDANNHQDYSIQIVVPRLPDSIEYFLAFLWNSEGYKQHILDSTEHFYEPDMYLWLIRKGTKGYDFDMDSTFMFPKDAISIKYWERASVSYLYSQGAFNKINTGD